MYTVPGWSRSPPAISWAFHGRQPASRAAKARVKPAGMCCATTTGKPRGGPRSDSTRSMAGGPPVEAPISTRAGAPAEIAAGKAAAGTRVGAGTRSLSPTGRASRRMRLTSALRSASKSTSEKSRLSTQSRAPMCSASRARGPLWPAASERLSERMITGVGRRLRISARVARPPRPGMARSRTIRSARQAARFSSSSSPRLAVPTSSMPGSSASKEAKALRMNGESSTTATRIMPLLPCARCALCAGKRSSPTDGRSRSGPRGR